MKKKHKKIFSKKWKTILSEYDSRSKKNNTVVELLLRSGIGVD